MDSRLTTYPNKKNIGLFEYQGEQQPIFLYPKGVFTRALDSTYQQLDAIITHYSKVVVVLIQLHQSEYTLDNKPLSCFFKLFLAAVKEQYSSTNNPANSKIAYAWAREESEERTNQHYHIAIMLNGSTCKSSYHINELAKQIWRKMDTNNRVWVPQRNTYHICRNQGHSATRCDLRAARMRMSYAAKRRTKELVPAKTRKFGFSHLSPK
ncbi:YagK/YfjJ domain-containing protein [Vibrio brasiliensis]|uniref:YagK/YfjJ domain-containing protein n=1 Tax=Vibrio brasiliensis TaxID=170652 RepID=UPI003CE4D60C